MHSITTQVDRVDYPIEVSDERARPPAVRWLWRNRFFVAIVLLPTVIVAAYYTFVAAPQYESEAHLLVRTAGQSGASSGLGAMMSFVGGGKAQGSAIELADYLTSMDAVQSLRTHNDLVARYRRPEADFIAQLPDANPTPEALWKYYKRQVTVTVDSESSITTVQVRSFRPEDSFAIINALMVLGEQRVNELNRRSQRATLGTSEQQVTSAEDYARGVGRELDKFRTGSGDIDPQSTSEMQMRLVGDLSGQLAQARAQLQSVTATIGTNNPQYQALRARVASLQTQVSAQDSRLVGGNRSIASGLGNYQELRLRQDFAAKRYDAAASSLEKARDEAIRQHTFVARLVEPNMPVKSTQPKGLKNTVTVFLGLLILFGIGWLLLAGVREHTA